MTPRDFRLAQLEALLARVKERQQGTPPPEPPADLGPMEAELPLSIPELPEVYTDGESYDAGEVYDDRDDRDVRDDRDDRDDRDVGTELELAPVGGRAAPLAPARYDETEFELDLGPDSVPPSFADERESRARLVHPAPVPRASGAVLALDGGRGRAGYGAPLKLERDEPSIEIDIPPPEESEPSSSPRAVFPPESDLEATLTVSAEAAPAAEAASFASDRARAAAPSFGEVLDEALSL